MSKKKNTTSKMSESEIALQESLEQNVKKRKRRKILLRIVLLILLLLLLFISIGIYFIINRPTEKKELALNIVIAPYTVEGDKEQQIASPKEYHYERGDETSGEEKVGNLNIDLTEGKKFKLEYKVKNLSKINYTYIIDLTEFDNNNLQFTYITNITPYEQEFPYGKKLILSYNNDFTFSVILSVKETASTFQCSGNVYFTIAIQGQGK